MEPVRHELLKMPTQKKKVKKAKENNDSKPAVNIKQEPEELKPLSAYVDDRLELLRQVFSCVKPKETKYLLPDFLEGKSNDIIKERCLDELLGISTKRLHSIITNTKCPTDTESSSENSDLEKIEEHISLDEISSDSDVEAKRASKRTKKAEKEMTVLELLELQARARAIRSQLALEPVTKIEIDSEHEGEDGRHGDIDTDDETNQRVRVSSKTSESAKNGDQLKSEKNQQQTKRVRLKRNFRIRKVGDEDDDDQDVSSNPPDSVREKSTEQALEIDEPIAVEAQQGPEKSELAAASPEMEQPSEQEPVVTECETNEQAADDEATAKTTLEVTDVNKNEEATAIDGAIPKAQDAERESSPEVIPVEASPETLCISSDSEEERLAKERAAIFVPNIEELDRQATKPPTPEPEKPTEDTEPEEGEISEEEEVPAPAEAVIEQRDEPTAETADAGASAANDTARSNESAEVEKQLSETEQDGTHNKVTETDSTQKDKTTEVQTLSSDSDGSGSESGSSSDSSSEAEEEEVEPKVEAPKLDNSAHDDEDIVEIHDSGDETLLLEDKPPEEEAKSWNSRWLKSNRVAKVMAASRLGNKVREKLKKKKQIQQAAAEQQLQESAADNPEGSQSSPKTIADPVAELPTNIELGSVEHYRELVAQQENKE
uniref:Uncharacterized protein n=1 Tax=Anopheles dirus TaxID=7168 RepID=A0A182NMS6_9DIPT